jgi:hypothetical protein
MGTPATISQVGSMWTANNNSGFATSIALNPVNIGDIFVLVIELKYSAASNRTVTGISGIGITWQATATFQRLMVDGIHAVEVWYGTVTATGSHTHTVSYSSTTGQTAGSINGHELTSTAGSTTVWSVDTTGFNDPNTSNTSFPYPTLTSALDKECYIGYLAITGSASAGSDAGWVYTTDLRGNWDAVNVNVGNAGTPASTHQTSGSSQTWFTVGVLFQAATATTTHALAATGLAATSGSFALPVTKPFAATGLASSSGSAALRVSWALAPVGLTASSGTFTFVSPQPLAAQGLAATSGAFLLGLRWLLAASGFAATTGAMSLAVRRVLKATSLASTTGAMWILAGRIQDPFAPVVSPVRPPILDCGIWRIFIATRGGRHLLAELDFLTLSLNRKLNDVSTCTVTVAADQNEECAPVLADIEPFEHELVAFRNYLPGDMPAWVGPVTLPTWDPLTLNIQARDLFSWFERRILPFDRSYTATDLAAIFGAYSTDALVQDASPNITLLFLGEIGVRGDRSVLASSRTVAGDALRELGRSGVDFSVLTRTLRYGGILDTSIATVLYDEAVYQDSSGPRYSKQGLNMATRVTIKGATLTGGSQIQATVGTPDAQHGLIDLVTSEPLIMDAASARQAGSGRLSFLNPAPQYLSLALTPRAPITFQELVPGIRIDTAFQLGLTTVVGSFRLQQVDAAVDNAGTETVSLTLIPLLV